MVNPRNYNEIVQFLKKFRDEVIQGFELLEGHESGARFERKNWDHKTGGGGEISVLRGQVFEKAAVNWSGVWGDRFPMNDSAGSYFATGVSLITHMSNPFAPTVHMNIRLIVTDEKRWVGGGFDLTPMGFPFAEDTEYFHDQAKKILNPHGVHLYSEFSKNAAEYFYIPHWKRERGVGGIFFDHFESGDFEKDLAMWKSVGSGFLESVMPIYRRRVHTPFTAEDRFRQLEMRGQYAEFNLLYDRGTQFGFRSGGNPEAILCSLPPLAKW